MVISEGTSKKILNRIETIQNIDIKMLIKTINKRIEKQLGRDYKIGHSYFSSLIGKEKSELIIELGLVFKQKIIPLLFGYFKADLNKIAYVLGDDKKDKEYRFIDKNHNSLVNDKAFFKPESYIKIYL